VRGSEGNALTGASNPDNSAPTDHKATDLKAPNMIHRTDGRTDMYVVGDYLPTPGETLATRSSRRRKNPVDLDQTTASSQKRRKQGSTHTKPADQSSSFS
jgi:hypothetical protein